MVTNDARAIIVDVAYKLFYSRGIQSVGMAELCDESRVSRKTFYSHFASKDELVAEVVTRWHNEFMTQVIEYAALSATPRDALLSVFNFLDRWFESEAFRGCGFINTFGEVGITVPAIGQLARDHKLSFQTHMAALAGNAEAPAWLAPQLAILVEGAITTAAIAGDSAPARQARRAAETLINAAMLVAA